EAAPVSTTGAVGLVSRRVSITFVDAPRSCEEPTAVHPLTTTQATPFSSARRSPSGAVASSAHDVPFHLSARPPVPTAVQSVGDTQDTPVSVPPSPSAAGVHCDPFHVSAVAVVPPTATQNSADVQLTPSRLAPCGRDWSVHPPEGPFAMSKLNGLCSKLP